MFIIWIRYIFQVIPNLLNGAPIIFPNKQFTILEGLVFLFISLIITCISLFLGIRNLKQFYFDNKLDERKVNFNTLFIVFILLMSTIPVAYSYIMEAQSQTQHQMIINIELLHEDFSEHEPGSEPDNWYPLDGNWTLQLDGDNLVYYQGDNSDKEALSISTIGDSSWVNYRYEVDIKFIERNTKKNDAGALLLFHYQGSNSYYYLWIKEYQNQLELYNHGAEGGGLAKATAPYILDTDIWYHVTITINEDIVNVEIDGLNVFTDINMNGTYQYGSVAIGTRYYKTMFDNINVEII